ncbi:RsiV family protein [Mariniflexile litorale]|uniref:RsiV family protein n=1 Tax=Mariniflexile litorale TaxID=3045158 RepID=A0AAU7EEM6_9FLAO|nr:RsiV family protein [Mariniflexile sp. KMM 9835]MDQ8212419.1 RsiV family protein [Mariniflexile sp. KMM 9835]
MKYIYLLALVLLLFSNCKNDTRNENINEIEESDEFKSSDQDKIQKVDRDIKLFDKTISIELKQKKLIDKKDESEELQKLLIDKKYVVKNKNYSINFKYPLLNESFKPSNANFNDFINNYYVNITKTESDIIESKLQCDSIESKTFREERFINYKIYNVNDRLVSVLFYKENFYSGAMHPSYSFDCFNFDLNRGVFMTYEDFFIKGSEDDLLIIINEKISKKIQKGDLYYECWELSSTDFFEGKNNFVLNDTYLEFYFDDCVMCPSYTGTYSIELPLTDLLPVLKKYDMNPLGFLVK